MKASLHSSGECCCRPLCSLRCVGSVVMKIVAVGMFPEQSLQGSPRFVDLSL